MSIGKCKKVKIIFSILFIIYVLFYSILLYSIASDIPWMVTVTVTYLVTRTVTRTVTALSVDTKILKNGILYIATLFLFAILYIDFRMKSFLGVLGRVDVNAP